MSHQLSKHNKVLTEGIVDGAMTGEDIKVDEILKHSLQDCCNALYAPLQPAFWDCGPPIVAVLVLRHQVAHVEPETMAGEGKA